MTKRTLDRVLSLGAYSRQYFVRIRWKGDGKVFSRLFLIISVTTTPEENNNNNEDLRLAENQSCLFVQEREREKERSVLEHLLMTARKIDCSLLLLLSVILSQWMDCRRNGSFSG